jgi:quercetin dioxygenase-like cupin family protein
MTRRKVFSGSLALIAVLMLGVVLAPRLAAQDATPSPAIAVAELAPGVTAEVLSGVPSARAEGQTVYTARFVFEPGAEIFPHSHPGTTSLTVYSGTFGWTLVEGTAYVIRGAAAGATEISETLTGANIEVILSAGDAIYYEDDVVHTARGAGDEDAVVYGTLVLTAGEPLLMPAGMDMGTPES